MVKISQRGTMDAFIVMDTLAKANHMERQGKTVYRFEAGQPTFSAPAPVITTAKNTLDTDKIAYTDPIGLPELRNAISKHYQDRYDYTLNPDRICITPGSSGAFSLAFLSCFSAGDTVAMAMPCYPSYKRILESFGVKILPLLSTEQDKYQPTVALLKNAQKDSAIDGLIIASPNNPTGTVLNTQELQELSQYCTDNNIRLISDELYHGVEFGEEQAQTALHYNENAIVINSFSKYFCMTGWRLGWIIIPENMKTTINNLQSNLFISAPTISQKAGTVAFDCLQELDGNIERYKKNKELFIQELPKMGITKFAIPEGGFYLYADISHITDDTTQWALDLLENAGVSVAAGADFDPYRGHHTIRFSYVCDYDHAKTGLEKLSEYIQSNS